MIQEDLIPKDELHPVKTDWTPPDSFPDLSSAKVIAIDLETFDPDLKEKGCGSRRDGYIAGVAVGTDDGFRGYFPVAHKLGGNMDKGMVMRWLKEELSRPHQTKIGANILYDLEYLAVEGVEVAGEIFDVQYAEPLLDENKFSYSLDNIAKEHLGESKVSQRLKDWLTMAYGKDGMAFIAYAPVGLVGPYAEGDVDLPLRIWEVQEKLLKEQNLYELFKMECSLLPVLLSMRLQGVRVAVGRAERIRAALVLETTKLNKQLQAITGTRYQVNVNSGDELGKVFDKIGIKYPITPKTKKPSIRKEWLESLSGKHPIIDVILKIRKYNTIISTFLDGYILGMNINGRIYGNFHPLRSEDGGTVSGRFSSSLPNLQNIPMRDGTLITVDGEPMPLGKAIRSCFIPEDDCLWYKDDYSQIEYRLMTHYGTGEAAEKARSAYVTDPDTDFHQLVADMCGIERSPAKNINFGLAYNMGADKLAESLGLNIEAAEALFAKYHANAPFVKTLQEDVANRAKDRGYIKTLLNRRARFPFWESTDWDTAKAYAPVTDRSQAVKKWGAVRRAYTYKASNRLIQGSAADILKKAMSDIGKSGVLDHIQLHLTVHDELDWSVGKDRISMEAHTEALHIMENCVKLKIPLVCDSESGPSWGEVTK